MSVSYWEARRAPPPVRGCAANDDLKRFKDKTRYKIRLGVFSFTNEIPALLLYL